MAKGGNSLSNKRSRNAKPYDTNNSFVKKVATKVTDLIPQRSWISKWFNSSQDNGEMLNDTDNAEDSENEQEPPQPPPSKRPRIRMDVTHPPGTFNIQPRSRSTVSEVDPHKEPYPTHSDTTYDFLEPPVAGTSGIRRLVVSTPSVQPEIRTVNTQRSRAALISLTSAQNDGAANGTDDNSESSESTSGCSSLIPQVNRQEATSSLGCNRSFTTRKRYMDDKLNFTNHLQSPRSLFLDSNPRDSLSSRRPSFNASVMNNSLERGPSYTSPFYNGNTTFGGANTAGFQRRGRTLFNSTNELQLKVPNRTNIQVKSPKAAGTDSSGMSQTAKRILEALEHFSSPILDAKKIPMNSNNSLSTMGGKKRQRDESGTPLARVGLRHLTRELTVPTVPDLLRLRRRQRLQDTTVVARKIVSARSGPPPAPQEYKLRSDDDEKLKSAGKVKTKNKTEFNDDVMVDELNLPNIALPISTLPTFDIMVPVSTSHTTRGEKEELFKFASPIKVTESSRNLRSINNFTFSKPINANDKDSIDESYALSKTLTLESNASSLSSLSTSNFMWSNTSTAPKLKDKAKVKDVKQDEVKISNNLKTGSVMDILGKKSDPLMVAWKPAIGMWECSQCLIRNSKDEMQCVACKASKSISKLHKPLENSSTSSIVTASQAKPVIADCFGSQFKMSSNQWECDACLVRNKQGDVKCVSCTTPRPGSIQAAPLTSTFNFVESGKSDLMDKFKPAEGSWECPGCMLRNPGAVETCPCCNASKPGSLNTSPKRVPAHPVLSSVHSNPRNDQPAQTNYVEKSKLIDGFWECSNCKVKNPSATLTCPCLSATNANSKGMLATGFGDKFKKPEGAWTCDDCMLQNKGDISECIACGAIKPGSKKITKSTASAKTDSSLQFNFGIPENAGGFKFGINKNDEKVEPSKLETVPSGFTFGAKSHSPKAGGFTFGVPQNPSGFTFTVTDNDKNKSESKTEAKEKVTAESVSKKRSLNTEEPTSQPSFLFAVPKTEEAKPVDEKEFAFGTQAPAAATTVPSFCFGEIKSGTDMNKTNELPKAIFGVANAETEKLICSPATTDKLTTTVASDQSNSLTTKSTNVAEIKPTLNSTFGTTNAVVTISGTGTTTSTESAPTPGIFSFGTSSAIPTQSGVQTAQGFGQNTVPISAPTSSMFVFGSNKPTNVTTAAPPEKSPIMGFGAANNPAFNAVNTAPLFESTENKSIPTFGITENKTVPLFGGTENKPPVFGAQDNKIPTFGSANATSTAFTSAAPAFGGTSAPPAFGSPSPAFGAAPASTFGTNSTPSMFAATKPADNASSTPSGLFTFGGSTAQPTQPQTSSGFNFSGNNAVATPVQPAVQKKLFTFGNNANPIQSGTGFGAATPNFNASTGPDTTSASFTFNAPKPEAPPFGQTAPITNPMFAAPQNAPNFGQTQTTPAFGSAAPAPSTGFNFGGSAPAAPAGFNFGGSALAAAPAPGGFTFNAPSPNPTVAFDPNTRPAFNFTGGSAPTAFNATPQATQPRKIKKAVRRTQPR